MASASIMYLNAAKIASQVHSLPAGTEYARAETGRTRGTVAPTATVEAIRVVGSPAAQDLDAPTQHALRSGRNVPWNLSRAARTAAGTGCALPPPRTRKIAPGIAPRHPRHGALAQLPRDVLPYRVLLVDPLARSQTAPATPRRTSATTKSNAPDADSASGRGSASAIDPEKVELLFLHLIYYTNLRDIISMRNKSVTQHYYYYY